MWLHWDRSWITCLTKATGKGQTQTKEGWRNHLSFATLLTAHSYFLHRRPFSLPNNQHWFGIAEAETLCLRLKARSKHTGACMSLRAERGKSKMMSVSTYKRPSGWKLSSVYLLLLFPTTCIGSSTNNLEEQQHPVRSWRSPKLSKMAPTTLESRENVNLSKASSILHGHHFYAKKLHTQDMVCTFITSTSNI